MPWAGPRTALFLILALLAALGTGGVYLKGRIDGSVGKREAIVAAIAERDAYWEAQLAAANQQAEEWIDAAIAAGVRTQTAEKTKNQCSEDKNCRKP